MRYILHYDIASLALAVVLLIHFYHKKCIKLSPTYVFISLAWNNLITVILDIITVWMDYYRLHPIIVYIVNVLYLLTFNLIPFLYFLYLLTSLKPNRRLWTRRERLILYVPLCVSSLLILTTPITKFIFYYNYEVGYRHGPGFGLLYAISMIYMAGLAIMAYSKRRQLNGRQRVAIVFYLSVALCGMTLQILFSEFLVLQYALSLALLMLYMSLENPGEDEDRQLGIYNRRGFDKVITKMTHNQVPFSVVIISITNYTVIRETLGVVFGQAAVKQLVMTLKAELHPIELYAISEGKLAIVVEDKKESLKRSLAILRGELSQTVGVRDMNISLETILMQLDYPKEISTLEDIFDTVDGFVTIPYESHDGDLLHIGQEIIQKRKRENRILQIMQQALQEESFQVYYQPIYSVKEGRFCSAEALLRLYDKEMGFISPDEFIPMAEKNGMILKIGEFVFNTVCKMMSREKIWEKGIDYIEVNLSVVQCIQEDICEMLYGIMDMYEIPYECINLEVTETTLERDLLWNTMERMTVGGVTFSLDDYGTGYSNLANLIKYPFHIVKLDKSMIWPAMENEASMKALRHTVAMLRDLDLFIVAEGVETQQQRDILMEMGCDYLQGYFYSKPIPEKDFLEKFT